MPLSRRAFLRIVGTGAVVLAAGAGAGAYLATRTPTGALRPWTLAGKGYDDPRLRALSWAILAPNPHNRQPWMVDLGDGDAATLYCDPDRRLPETDPFDRQIVIGLGCFLEVLRQAAAEDGRRLEVAPFPAGTDDDAVDGRPVAHLRFVADPGVARDPLFAQVPRRHTNREPFDTGRPVSEGALAALAEAATVPGVAASATADPARREALRDLTWRGHQIEMGHLPTLRESVDLMRIGRAEIEANPDGISLGGPMMDTMALVGLLDRPALADTASFAYGQGMDWFRRLMHSAMAHAWLVTDGNTRADQLAAGAAWVRLHLRATELGVQVQPLSQALQEFAPMAPLLDEVHRLLDAGSGQRVQMLGRLGHGPDVGPSPRWPLATRLGTV